MHRLDIQTVECLMGILKGENLPYKRDLFEVEKVLNSAGIVWDHFASNNSKKHPLYNEIDFKRTMNLSNVEGLTDFDQLVLRLADPKLYPLKYEWCLETIDKLNQLLAPEGYCIKLYNATPELLEIKPGIFVKTPIVTASIRNMGLHLLIQDTVGTLFENGNYDGAVFIMCIQLIKEVQGKSQRKDLDGTKLMELVFSPKEPILRISNDTNEQRGWMELFRGIVAAIRNEKAHNNDNHLDYQTSLEWLNYISALLRVLERSEYIEKKQ